MIQVKVLRSYIREKYLTLSWTRDCLSKENVGSNFLRHWHLKCQKHYSFPILQSRWYVTPTKILLLWRFWMWCINYLMDDGWWGYLLYFLERNVAWTCMTLHIMKAYTRSVYYEFYMLFYEVYLMKSIILMLYHDTSK